MPERFKKRCSEPGCLEKTTDRSGYCEAHRKDNVRNRQRAAYDAERHKDPVQKLYNSITWDRLKIRLRGLGNVICARLVDGRQCTHPVEIFHHIISPREDVTLFFKPTNIRPVCRQHHPPTEGEPKENLKRLDEIYVPIIWTEIYIATC